MTPATYFAMLAGIAIIAALLLRLVDRPLHAIAPLVERADAHG